MRQIKTRRYRPVPPDTAVNDGVLLLIAGKIEHSDFVAWPMAGGIAANIILEFRHYILFGAKSDNRIIDIVASTAARTVLLFHAHDFARGAKTSCFQASDFNALINPNSNEDDGKNSKQGGEFYITLQLCLLCLLNVRRRNDIFNGFDFGQINRRLAYMVLFFPFLDGNALPFGNENAVSAFRQIYDHGDSDDPGHSRDRVGGERNITKPDAWHEKYYSDDIE